MATVNDSKSEKSIDIWKEKLLDLGKKNNLINFHDKKALEVLLPSFSESFKLLTGSSIQVFNSNLDYLNDEDKVDNNEKIFDKQDFISKYQYKIRKSQVLLFNSTISSNIILKNL